MTVLVGVSDTTGYATSTSSNLFDTSDIIYLKWTAVATGTATALYAYLRDSGHGQTYRLCIYDSGGNLLGYTSGTVNQGTGWQGGATNQNVSITSGQSYSLGMYVGAADGTYAHYMGTGSNTTVYTDTASGSFASPAATLSETTRSTQPFLMYADGDLGGSIVPQAMANYRMRAA